MPDLLSLALRNETYSPYSGPVAKSAPNPNSTESSPALSTITPSTITLTITSNALGLTFLPADSGSRIVCRKVSRTSPLYAHAPILTNAYLLSINDTTLPSYASLQKTFIAIGPKRPITFTFEYQPAAAEAFYKNQYEASQQARSEGAARLKSSGLGSALPNCFNVMLDCGSSNPALSPHDVTVALSPHDDVLISSLDRHGSNALHFAAGSGCPTVILDYLLDVVRLQVDAVNVPKGKDSATGSFGRSALHWASRNGHADTVKYLIARGADVSLRTPDGTTAVMWAMWNGHCEVGKYLVSKGANLLLCNDFGCTVGHFVALSGCIMSMMFFVEEGGDLKKVNEQGHNVIHKAAWKGNLEMLQWLKNEGGLQVRITRAASDERRC